MGGSHDDPVVAVAGRALLEKGFVLGTFNFRYACMDGVGGGSFPFAVESDW
jgi:alpha/beta superfamily hydrolase